MPVPSVRELVPRASFVEAVAVAIRTHRLIVIQAPAGYGKTSAGALIVDAVDLPTAWYTAQPWHAGVFVEPLVSEVRTVREDFGRLTLALAAHGRPPSDDPDALRRWMARIGASFAQELGNVPQRLILVVEDYHVFEGDAALWEFVAGAMRQLPETVTLVLIGRATPALPLAEWIAQGRAAVFGAQDLKFNAPETQLVAQRHGLDVDERRAAELCAQYEGWPAGISLLVSAQTRTATHGEPSNMPNATQLIAQHVATLPNGLIDFLERTSPLEILEASMLEQYGGLPGARHQLRDLERRGEMLSVLRSGETYRLHPLMREAMIDRVRERDGDEGVAHLHAWAGGMLDAAGRHAPALFHLERSRDEARLVKFLNAQVGALFADGHGEQAAKAVRELTKRGVDAPVLVGRVQGMLLRQRGQPGARELFLAALAVAKERGDEDSVFALRVQLLWGALDSLDPTVGAEISGFVREADGLGTLQKATALILLGWTKTIEADWQSALEKAAAAAELGAASPDLRYRAALLYAYVATCLGEFGRADAKLSELLRDLEASEHVVLLCCTLFWYARLSLVWGDANAAADYARQGMALGRDLNLHAELASVYYVLVEIAAGAGQRETCAQATDVLREHGSAAWYAPDRKRIAAFSRQMVARCAFAGRRADEALQIVQAALKSAAPPPAESAAMMADAALYAVLTRRPEARTLLAEATKAVTTTAAFDAVDGASLATAGAMLALLHAVQPDGLMPGPRDLEAAQRFGGLIASRKDVSELYELGEALRRLATGASAHAAEDVAALTAASRELEHRGALFEASAVAALLETVVGQHADVAAEGRAKRPGWQPGPSEPPIESVPRAAALTKRELEVLELVRLGLRNKEIAQRLDLSRRTVETHVERVLSKLNATSRTRAVAEGMRMGLLPADAWGAREEAFTA
jgi:LuxR family transcriptional regulator, maltose regulon positive regulatory protein